MQTVLEDTGDAVVMPQQHPRLVSRIFRDYRNNLGLFWRVMLPLIIINFLLFMGMFLLASPEMQWTMSTAGSLAAHTSSSESAPPVGIAWGMQFGTSTHIGLLWLAMCPLIFTIVQRRNGIELTFKAVWQQTLRKAVPILGIAFLIGILMLSIPVILGLLLFELSPKEITPSSTPTLFFVFACFIVVWFLFSLYYFVKWSLYNQGIMIENLSAIGALRRSSALVRGRTWWRFFGIYLLLSYGATVLTSLLLGLTIVSLSFAVPEFIPMREILLPQRFIRFLFLGYAKITLENAPNFWTIGAIVSVYTLVYAIMAPVWASLTTHLYMERVDRDAQQVSA